MQLLLALAEYAHAVAEQSAVCTFFSLLPADLTALLWSVGLFSGAVFYTRLTLARSAVHGFQIGLKMCIRSKSVGRQYILLNGSGRRGGAVPAFIHFTYERFR